MKMSLLIAMSLFSAAAAPTSHPLIQKLGTIDCDMVETTPIVFHDRLYRVEYVREQYTHKAAGQKTSYFRAIDVATGKPTPSFARGYHLCSAYVQGETVYVFGVEKWGADKIACFKSTDLQNWQNEHAIALPGWSIFNTSVCKGPDRYIMAIEVGGPPEVTGVPFTIRFAESRDLKTWTLLGDEYVYAKDRYTSCPTLRFIDGHYYLMYCEALPGPVYPTYLLRSTDLLHWESSPVNPVMKLSPEDQKVADNASLTDAERTRVANAKNVCNSDIDLCEFNGKVVLYYCWGNQTGIEHLAEARYDGTLKRFYESFFPATSK
jgi:hypothetical protein